MKHRTKLIIYFSCLAGVTLAGAVYQNQLSFCPLSLLTLGAICMILFGTGSYLYTKIFTDNKKSTYGQYFWWGLLSILVIALVGGGYNYLTAPSFVPPPNSTGGV